MKDAHLAGAGIHSQSMQNELITWVWGRRTNNLYLIIKWFQSWRLSPGVLNLGPWMGKLLGSQNKQIRSPSHSVASDPSISHQPSHFIQVLELPTLSSLGTPARCRIPGSPETPEGSPISGNVPIPDSEQKQHQQSGFLYPWRCWEKGERAQIWEADMLGF